jgi:hypothetical protein
VGHCHEASLSVAYSPGPEILHYFRRNPYFSVKNSGVVCLGAVEIHAVTLADMS